MQILFDAACVRSKRHWPKRTHHFSCFVLCVVQVRAKIVRGDYEMPDALFQHLSADAKDFISALLVTDPDTRMSADQALAHPWLRRVTK